MNPPVYYLDDFDTADGIQAALDAGIAVPAATVAIYGHAALEARKLRPRSVAPITAHVPFQVVFSGVRSSHPQSLKTFLAR